MGFFENKFNFTLPQDINIYYCGKRIHTLNHCYGPYVKNHFLMNFVTEGNATAHFNNQTFRIHKNQVFVMFPNSKIFYEADPGTYWSIKWIGIYGNLVYKYLSLMGLTFRNPIVDNPHPQETERVLDDLFECTTSSHISEQIRCISLVQRLFSLLTTNCNITPTANDYIDYTLNFIQYHYDRSFSIQEIADNLNVNNNYLSKLFKANIGVTPMEYINRIRIQRACYLLKNTTSSISEIANSIGISDPFYFSRFFKKQTGVTPSKYRSNYPLDSG